MTYKQQNVFFTVLEAGKSNVKMLADPVPSESSSKLQMADFLLYLHMMRAERGSKLSSVSSEGH